VQVATSIPIQQNCGAGSTTGTTVTVTPPVANTVTPVVAQTDSSNLLPVPISTLAAVVNIMSTSAKVPPLPSGVVAVLPVAIGSQSSLFVLLLFVLFIVIAMTIAWTAGLFEDEPQLMSASNY
jgi:hypothetical protein